MFSSVEQLVSFHFLAEFDLGDDDACQHRLVDHLESWIGVTPGVAYADQLSDVRVVVGPGPVVWFSVSWFLHFVGYSCYVAGPDAPRELYNTIRSTKLQALLL